MFKVKVIAHSICNDTHSSGEERDIQHIKRTAIVTLVATYPRFIHSELMTHRMFARNAASSRAIPYKKLQQCIIDYPVIPIHWGLEQKGMQSDDVELSEEDKKRAEQIILAMREACLLGSQRLAEMGLHKSICNRYIEPWMWITTVITATEWNNFFRLRCHSAAERHFQKIAYMMKEAIANSVPNILEVGEWHLPYVQDDERHLPIYILKKVSAARCARVSYLNQEGKRDISDDLKLFSRLIERDDDVIHASPLEHVARARGDNGRSGCFVGWDQFRKEFSNENAE